MDRNKRRKESCHHLKEGDFWTQGFFIMKHSKDGQRHTYNLKDKSKRIEEQKAQLQSLENRSTINH